MAPIAAGRVNMYESRLELTDGVGGLSLSECRLSSSRHDFLLRQRKRVKQGLHRGLAEAPSALMGPPLIIQRGAVTPTIPTRRKSARFSILGIPGLDALSSSMR